MKQIALHQNQQAIDLLAHCFEENANFRFLFGSKKRIQKQLNRFLSLCLNAASEKNSVYLSDDEQGVAIIYPVSVAAEQKSPVRLKHAFKLFPLFRIPKIVRFQKKVAHLQPKEDHLFFQFLAVGNSRNNLQTVLDLKEACFELSDVMHLPIYTQTSNDGTKKVYERFGFNCYAALPFPKSTNFMYFMKRETS